MADREHPKTHVENDKDVDLPRKQPLSPQHEGIDPLTESDTMYSRENVKADAEKFAKNENRAEAERLENGESSDEDARSAELTDEQNEVSARSNTPDASLPAEEKTAPANKQQTSPSNKNSSKKS